MLAIHGAMRLNRLFLVGFLGLVPWVSMGCGDDEELERLRQEVEELKSNEEPVEDNSPAGASEELQAASVSVSVSVSASASASDPEATEPTGPDDACENADLLTDPDCATVQLYGDEGFGLCTKGRKNECAEFIGSEPGVLPIGTYFGRAEVQVPEIGEGWEVEAATSCSPPGSGSAHADGSVSDAEGQAYFEKNKDRFYDPARIRLKMITIAIQDGDSAGAEEKIEAIHADLVLAWMLDQAEGNTNSTGSGGDVVPFGKVFHDTAMDNSQDNYVSRGGDVSWIEQTGRPGIPQVVIDQAFALPVGGLSGPILSDTSWHIVWVKQRKEAEEPTYQQHRETVLSELEDGRTYSGPIPVKYKSGLAYPVRLATVTSPSKTGRQECSMTLYSLREDGQRIQIAEGSYVIPSDAPAAERVEAPSSTTSTRKTTSSSAEESNSTTTLTLTLTGTAAEYRQVVGSCGSTSIIGSISGGRVSLGSVSSGSTCVVTFKGGGPAPARISFTASKSTMTCTGTPIKCR